MRKLFFLLLLCFITTQFASAQGKKIYVSRHGGTKKILTLGKIGYNYYRLSYKNGSCDTLICSGSGFEMCKIDKYVIKANKEEGKYYAMYNRAIRETLKRVRRSRQKDGQFNMLIDNVVLSVKFSNADKKGNADMNIEIISS